MATEPHAPRTAHAPRRWLGVMSLAMLAAVGIAGCGYPPISAAAFDLAKALDNLCNLKATEQLPQARRMIDEQTTAGALSPRESKWLLEIVKTAEEGNWEAAAAQTRRMLVDQQRK